jgi:aryl-alcohol dehydrogenase-like predicted oxidoreductase
MNFLRSLVSKKLGVTAAAIALIQALPMSADMQGVCTAALALAYVLAQAWVDSHEPAAEPEPQADE